MPSLEFIFKLCSNASITARTDSDKQNTNDKKTVDKETLKQKPLFLCTLLVFIISPFQPFSL